MLPRILCLFLNIGLLVGQNQKNKEWKNRLLLVEQKLDHIADQLSGLSSLNERQINSAINERLDAMQRTLEQKLLNVTSAFENMLVSKLNGKIESSETTKEVLMQADEQFSEGVNGTEIPSTMDRVTELPRQPKQDEVMKILKSLEKLINELHWKEMRRMGRILRNINANNAVAVTAPIKVVDEDSACTRVDAHLQRVGDNLERDHKDIQQGVNLLQHQLSLDMGSGLRAMQVDILQCTRSVTELHKSILGMPKAKFSDRMEEVSHDDPSVLIFNRHPRPIGIDDAYLQEMPSMQVVNTVLADRPRSCAEVYEKGYKKSGIFSIWPQFNSSARLQLYSYCDMETNGGGWTVIQRRGDYGGKLENFTRLWADYKRGFGHLSREFWLGLDAIYALSNQEAVTLRIELEPWHKDREAAEYGEFQLANETEFYRLKIGNFSGNIPDCMEYHNDVKFSTLDSNNAGLISRECAKNQGQGGGWWYDNCYRAKLNSPYYPQGKVGRGEGIQWMCEGWLGYWYSVKFAEMKLRPNCFLDTC